jgi:N-formylglutamate deformylase
MNSSTLILAPAPITVTKPSSTANNIAPVVFDSPHSGTFYPPDFNFSVPLTSLRGAEDTHVEALYATAAEHGATLIAANFPRSYIDANRSLLDIDTEVIDGVWTGPVSLSEKAKNGIGLIWRLTNNGAPIYTKKLQIAEVQARIENYYTPYHHAVKEALDTAHQQYGGVWHINCHSMPAISSAIDSEGPGIVRADFVLGDRDGTSCAPEFTNFVASQLRAMGYSVKINDPYKGVELVRAYSNPTQNRHSLQVEINCKLYMNELSRERTADFAALQTNIDTLIASITRYAVEQIGKNHEH